MKMSNGWWFVSFEFLLLFISFNIAVNIITGNVIHQPKHTITVIAGFPSELNQNLSIDGTRYFLRLVVANLSQIPTFSTSAGQITAPTNYTRSLLELYLPFGADQTSELKTTTTTITSFLSQIPVVNALIKEPPENIVYSFLMNYSNDLYKTGKVTLNVSDIYSHNYAVLIELYRQYNSTAELVSYYRFYPVDMSYDYLVIALDPNTFTFHSLEFNIQHNALSQFYNALSLLKNYLKPVQLPIEPLNTIYQLIYVVIFLTFVLQITATLVNALKP